MESKVINHFSHEHPLILTKNVCGDKGDTNCYACGTPVGNLEMAYVCMQKNCSSSFIFHNKCGDLPLQISHPKHLQHPMKLIDFRDASSGHWCDQCGRDIGEELGYCCHDCEFKIDTICVEALLEGRQELQHPCHPGHTLTLMRKGAFAFRCDGCGAQDVDMAYICSSCEFWVHKSCALLPTILSTNHHHHHPLSLIIPLSKEYCNYRYRCDVCDKFFDKTCWVYSCGDCRYFVHLKCVESTTQPDSNVNEDEDDVCGANVIQFPLDANEISNKVITPFVIRETGGADQTNSLLFNYHNHPLSLVSSFTPNENEGDDDEDDDDDDDDDEDRKVKVCDVCVSPISSPPYYKCSVDACTYFIHSICSLLPNTLHSSSPDLLKLYGDCQGMPNKNHNFTLFKPKHMEAISFWLCNLCSLYTNGMGYECGECKMKIDVKCASRPTTIKYSSYPPHHKPLILTRLDEATSKKKKKKKKKKCYLCRSTFTTGTVYCCVSEKCDFVLHWECALLPRSITEHEWDNKHPLLLMYDAFIDHPSDFYCEFCEEQMHPKNWKYHCRPCDITYHRACLETESGVFRNIKFGRRFELGDHIHPHSLTFTYVTLKKFCDLCHENIYTDVGLECAACYYVVCMICCYQELNRCK